MLDWRGLIGTFLVHGAAVAGWPALGPWLMTTTCLCWTPSYEVVAVYDVPKVRQVQVYTNVNTSIGRVSPYAVQHMTCSAPPDRAPVLVWQPTIPAYLRAAASIAFCATVRPDGTISGLRLLRSGHRPARAVAAARRLVGQARFAPGEGSRRIEIALTT